ncbi:hypothetical protein A2852_01320 [Candidatus Adlerbacteria bacterium RIFCSPHIGHO2_01_FULL_54_23]|uniref:Methyltransferase FkbM domain-containing protein n=3 Tax=Candidatus Adleribacteriota TaxID=1752736 RepID=A0A1F4Y058_9BACT|nr:MAG: Methyltransferase FkbM family [Candidatus Adlerbacteria bacterium GW2011_GWA1_54_10]KKW36381.1 MAG: Methyltransferase FkbM family [Candidatus Adlerbacteria bacterium GW2011_GWA2_54_12]KKW37467.1 MAG: Methyltransferase FkbM family [Candidatus Adlerbacteria bacterium GW2011_GWB1_54_7]OGC79250.1 MAG: hypothetical protein A2852_01320 [Candidatus Adlerbacteria bacterium RIFCSPHIGHO2_01_FULL_54_23]OGC87360.1 MAG: hypothetical protein A3B33_00210 [Candidatus Adlerbacteria bacterium RIFCSPLOWO2
MRVVKEYWQTAEALGGDDFWGRMLLFLRLAGIPLRKKIFGLRPRRLKLEYEGRVFALCIRDGADVAVLREVFAEQEYATAQPAPKKIIDIGSHMGASAAFFACRYPEARIIAYEPDPRNFLLLQENMRQFPLVSCEQAAVSDRAGERPFFANKTSSISSSLLRRGGSEEELHVRSVSLLDILQRENPDLVKFDAEGGEWDMFASAGVELKRCGTFVGEVHFDLIKKSEEEFTALFSGFEYSERSVGHHRSIFFFYLRA